MTAASTPFDRVWFHTSTTGNGAVAVGAAVTNYQTPLQAGVPNGATVTYTIQDGSAWEIGRSNYSANAVTRSLLSSSTGALLSLSGQATMMFTIAASDINLLNANTAAAVANIASLQSVTTDPVTGNGGLDSRLTSVERDLVSLDLNRAATTMSPTAVGFSDDFEDLSGINAALSGNYNLWAPGDLTNVVNSIATNATQSFSPPASMPMTPFLVADFVANNFVMNGTVYPSFSALYTAAGMSGTYVQLANGISCYTGQGIVYPMTTTAAYAAITINADITSATTGVAGLGQSTSIYRDLFVQSQVLSWSHTSTYDPYKGEPLPQNANAVSNINALAWFGSATQSRTGGCSINGQYEASASYGTSTTGTTNLYFGRNYTAGGVINNGVVHSFAVYQSATLGVPIPQSIASITQDAFDGSAITPIVSGSSNATGTISASSFNASYPPANVTRYDLDTGATWPTGWSGTGLATEWLQYQFTNPICPSKYRFSIGAANTTNGSPLGWQFLASNDGVNWTVLDTQGAQTPSLATTPYVRDYFVNTNVRYTYFRLLLNGNTYSGYASYPYCIGLWMIFDKHAYQVSNATAMAMKSNLASTRFVPSRIYGYFAIKPSVGAPNTDFIAAVTRDGTHYTPGTLNILEIQPSGYSLYELSDSTDGKPGVNVSTQNAVTKVGYALVTSPLGRQDFGGADVRGIQ